MMRAHLCSTVVVIVALAGAGCQGPTEQTAQETSRAKEQPTMANPVEQGRYLATILACNDCHTPFKMGTNGPEPDMTRELSGHPEDLTMPPPPVLPEGPWLWMGAATNTAFAGPWGVSFATNLTSDQDTGMGVWTEEMFVKAMRTGRHFGTSRPILPPMPWPSYGKMTDEDLKALFAYLRTVRAIKNHVPDAVLPSEPAP